ncbi:MAG: FtsW/RodA/SpoVE family cell cycle protein [Acidimicrobiales bacterium]|nr:FtsW/RodA/SpoVE family cell cycle protein [Acidimicrobiales bacterium]
MKSRNRNVEFFLLLFVAILVVAGYVLASLGRSSSIPANIVPFLVGILLLLLLAHFAVRKFAPRADFSLLPLAGLLNGIGYFVIARLDKDLAGLQATWTLFGVGAFIATLVLIPQIRRIEQYRYILMTIGVIFLIMPLIPGFGREINGARIWVSLGSINFQPGEFAKIVLAIFFSAYIVEKRDVLSITGARRFGIAVPDFRHLGPILLAWGVSLVVMVAEKDLGSSLLFFTLFISLLWISTGKTSYLVMSAVLFFGGALLAWSQFSHVQERVDIWIHPFNDPTGDGYQIVQSSFALAEGGLTGTGLGVGNPENIPAVETDFILAAIGEELGLIGTTAVLILFVLMVGSGLRISLTSTRPFEKLLSAGLTTLLGFQAFVIIAGVVRLLPLTGVTLPFVSYGGSSLLANWILLALLLRISDEARKGEEGKAPTASEPQ